MLMQAEKTVKKNTYDFAKMIPTDEGTRGRNRLRRQVHNIRALGSIPTEDEPQSIP